MRRIYWPRQFEVGQNGQKLGALRYMSLDVEQLYGVAELGGRNFSETMELSQGASRGLFNRAKVVPPPPPQPQKITVTASVQCAFQIQ